MTGEKGITKRWKQHFQEELAEIKKDTNIEKEQEWKVENEEEIIYDIMECKKTTKGTEHGNNYNILRRETREITTTTEE